MGVLEKRRGRGASQRTRRGRWVSMLGLTTVTLALGCYRGVDGGVDGSAGLDDADGDGDGDGGMDDGDEIPAELEPAPARLRLLLQRQYVGAVEDLLGPQAAAVANPPENHAINGLDAVGASQLALGDAEIDAFERSARAVVEAAVAAGTLSQWLACDPATQGEAACLEQVAGSFGRRAWRRPLTAEELQRYTAVGTSAAADLGFDHGLQEVVAAILQSPHFLYQVEVGEPDPDDASRRRLTQYELATRMSFFLVDTVPDAALLDDAEAGLLSTADGIRDAAARLLERPRARGSLGEFFGETWRLRNLDALPKDLGTFPQWTPELAQAMRQETLALVEDIAFERDVDFREVFTASYTFADARLGFHYGLPGAAELSNVHTKVALEGIDMRAGLFGHGSFQALLGHVSSTSPTLRGKFVLENILCRVVPPPPPGVVTDLPVGDGTETMRERLEIHMSDPSCAGCHSMMDPIGFGLENYDGIGQFRTLDNGSPIDASASIDGRPFEGAAGLGTLVAETPDAPACLVRNLYRDATGHIEGEGEEVALVALEDAFIESGYNMQSLLVEIVASPAFRVVAEPE